MKRKVLLLVVLANLGINFCTYASEPSVSQQDLSLTEHIKEQQRISACMLKALEKTAQAMQVMCDSGEEQKGLIEELKNSIEELKQSQTVPVSDHSAINSNHPYLQIGMATFYYFIIIPFFKKWAKKQNQPALKTLGNIIALNHKTLCAPFTCTFTAITRLLRSSQKIKKKRR